MVCDLHVNETISNTLFQVENLFIISLKNVPHKWQAAGTPQMRDK